MKRTRTSIKTEVHPGTMMACDPSLTAWGWVILSWKGRIIDCGCIKTEPSAKKLKVRKGNDDVRRIDEINQKLLDYIEIHHVTYIVSELPHGSQNAAAAKMVGMVPGILQTMSNCLKIGIEWYSENDAKKLLFTRKTVSKQETIDKIDELYDVPWTGTKYKDEAIADALAIHNAAIKTSSTLKLFKTYGL